MKHLFEGEIFVDTVFSVESGAGSGNWFYIADYATMHEFMIDCEGWFSDEDNPEYLYTDWKDIPDHLINRTWLCPNIFEIRDAIQQIERQHIGPFVRWCIENGHDLKTDDPLLLVTRFQDYFTPVYEPDPDTSEPEDNPSSESLQSLIGLGFSAVEIFDDNYN